MTYYTKLEKIHFDLDRIKEMHQINLPEITDNTEYSALKKFLESENSTESERLEKYQAFRNYCIKHAAQIVPIKAESKEQSVYIEQANLFLVNDLSTQYLHNQIKHADDANNKMKDSTEQVRDWEDEHPTPQRIITHFKSYLQNIDKNLCNTLEKMSLEKGKKARSLFIGAINDCRLTIIQNIMARKIFYTAPSSESKDQGSRDEKILSGIQNLKNYSNELEEKGEKYTGEQITNLANQLNKLASQKNYFLIKKLLEVRMPEFQHRNNVLVRLLSAIANLILTPLSLGYISFGVFTTKREKLATEILENVKSASTNP